jgi:hypothetical protein
MHLPRVAPLPLLAPLLLFAPLLASCATVARTAPALPIAGDPAPNDVYARMNAAIADAGGLHAELTTQTIEAPQPYITTQHLWLDGLGRARAETTTTFMLAPPVTRHASSVVDGAAVTVAREETPTQTQQALACRQAPDAALATLFGCRGFLEASETLVQEGTSYGGVPATALISRGVAPGVRVRTWFEDTLYVDTASALPIALETAAIVDDGQQRRLRTVTTYRYERLDATLAPALFDATVLSGPRTAPVAALGDLAPGVPWPRRINADGAQLVLASTFVAVEGNAGWLPYRAELAYRPASDSFAPADVALQLFPPGTPVTDGAVFIDAPPGRIVVRAAMGRVPPGRLEAVAAAITELVRS